MQIPLNIEFDQLVTIVRALPARQLKKLKLEIERETKAKRSQIDLEALLLHGPVATKKQLEIIKNNRKAINQWRAK